MLQTGTRGPLSSVAARIVYFALAALPAGCQRADAATALRDNEADVIHFAFATQLGSGVYAIAGRTIQVHRLPTAWTIAEPGDGRPGVRLRLPATFGLYDFAARDVVDSGLPDRLDTFSAAGGIELDFPLAHDWHVIPYAEAGLTLGGRSPARIWKLPLPRIGLAYRFGDGISVYRLVFGAPF